MRLTTPFSSHLSPDSSCPRLPPSFILYPRHILSPLPCRRQSWDLFPISSFGGLVNWPCLCHRLWHLSVFCCTWCLLLGRKAVTTWDSILKRRGNTLPTKVCLVKAMVFPLVVYGCDSCTTKKTEHRRIDAFELWCWRRCLSPLNRKEIKLINPKGNQPEYSLQG